MRIFFCLTLGLGLWATAPSTMGAEPSPVIATIHLPGSARGMAVDSTSDYAYVSNGSALFVLDLFKHRIEHSFPLRDGEHLGDIGEHDLMLSLSDFRDLVVTDLGVHPPFHEVVSSASAFQGSAIANGMVYAPSFNTRAVRGVSMSDGLEIDIHVGSGDLDVGLCGITRSPRRSLLLVGDSLNDVAHVIDSATNEPLASVPVGFDPCLAAFVAEGRAVFADATDGTLVVVRLDDPFGRPLVIRTDLPGRVTAVAADPQSQRVFFAHAVPFGEPVCDDEDALALPEVVEVSLLTRSITRRTLVDDDTPAAFPRYDLQLTPDGRSLLLAGSDGVYVLDVGSLPGRGRARGHRNGRARGSRR